MARQPRVEFRGAVYHVMCRGNRGEVVFREDSERTLWLDTMEEAVEKTGWRVHAYVLMDNHYHFLLETHMANLVNRWISSKLSMGAPAYVSMLVKKVKEAKRGRLRKLRGKMSKLVQ